MESFGARVKELRIATGLSQEKLAGYLQVDARTIARYEKDQRPDTYVLAKMATFFDVSADYLLGLKTYEEMLVEKRKKLKGIEGYNLLYSRYVQCLTSHKFTAGAIYYWIWMDKKNIGGLTQWVGWQDEAHTMEIRRLRPVVPDKIVEVGKNIKGKMMVVNSQRDANIFLIYGGQAVVRKDICEQYLSMFCEDYIVGVNAKPMGMVI